MQVIVAKGNTIFHKSVLGFGFFIVLLVISFIQMIPVHAAPVNSAFTDQNFYNCIIDRLNATSVNGVSDRVYTYNVTDGELVQITSLTCSGSGKATNLKISNTAGLQKLTALTWLDLNSNQLTTIDVSHNTALYYLKLNSNQLTTIDVSHNTALNYLYINSNQLTTINISLNTALTSLELNSNQLTTINISLNTSLTDLYLGSNQLTTIDLSHNTSLTDLYLSSNQLTTVDVSHNTALTDLRLSYNQLTTIDISLNTALVRLDLNSNQLAAIDVSHNTVLTYLYLDLPLFKAKPLVISSLITLPTTITYNSPGSNFTLDIPNDSITANNINSGTLTGSGTLSGKTLDVIYNLKTVNSSTSYYHTDSGDNNIVIDNLDIAALLGKLTVTNGSAKIFNGSRYLTTGTIATGNTLRIMYGTRLMNEYNISTMNFGSLASNVLLTKRVIKQPIGSLPSVFNAEMATTGNISVASISKFTLGGAAILADTTPLVTGARLRAIFSDDNTRYFEYRVAVTGDITGDGLAAINDVAKLYQHARGTSVMTDDYNLEAGDVTSNGSLAINDVAKLYQYVRGAISAL